MNLEGAALKLLLTVEDRADALDAFSELRPDFFSSGSKTIYDSIASFYSRYGAIPTTQQLLASQTRNEVLTHSVESLDLIDVTSLELDFICEELKNQYTHLETMRLLESFVQNSILLSREEIIEQLAEIPLELERSLQETFKVGTVSNTPFFKTGEDHARNQILSGISDSWDYEAGGYFVEDLILYGGRRGSGKSLVCANMILSQHEQGNVSMYFTIEMTKEEVFGRIICMKAGISAANYRTQSLTPEEEERAAAAIADFFIGGTEVFEKYFRGAGSRDVIAFQRELQTTKKEKDEGKIIIVDDPNLSLATIDAKVNTYKRIYGEKLKLVCVDYVNQVKLHVGLNLDMYDWKNQILIAKTLKDFARKFKVCMVSPYQIDASGEARMSKGILDAADIAQVLKKEGEIMKFENVKARGVKEGTTNVVSISETCLRIDPKEVIQEEEQPQEQEQERKTTWDLP